MTVQPSRLPISLLQRLWTWAWTRGWMLADRRMA